MAAGYFWGLASDWQRRQDRHHESWEYNTLIRQVVLRFLCARPPVEEKFHPTYYLTQFNRNAYVLFWGRVGLKFAYGRIISTFGASSSRLISQKSSTWTMVSYHTRGNPKDSSRRKRSSMARVGLVYRMSLVGMTGSSFLTLSSP